MLWLPKYFHQNILFGFEVSLVQSLTLWLWTSHENSLLSLFSHLLVSDSLQPWTAAHQASMSFTLCWSLLTLMSTESTESVVDHPTISSSVVPFSCSLQPFPASGSFPLSQLFTSGGQSIGVSASAPVLPMNIHNWFPLGLNGLISLQTTGL